MPSTSQGVRTDNPIKNVQQVVSSIEKFEFPHNFEVESFKTMGISIQMDFSETLGEISISSTILENLRHYFLTEEWLDLKVIISDISKSNQKTEINSKLLKFIPFSSIDESHNDEVHE